MKVYVASAAGHWPAAYNVILALDGHGHTITHDWTADIRNGIYNVPGKLTDAQMHGLADADIVAVQEADAVVLLYRAGMRGAWCEVGAALALGKPVIVLDDEDKITDDAAPCVFLYHSLADRQRTITGVLALLAFYNECGHPVTAIAKNGG